MQTESVSYHCSMKSWSNLTSCDQRSKSFMLILVLRYTLILFIELRGALRDADKVVYDTLLESTTASTSTNLTSRTESLMTDSEETFNDSAVLCSTPQQVNLLSIGNRLHIIVGSVLFIRSILVSLPQLKCCDRGKYMCYICT